MKVFEGMPIESCRFVPLSTGSLAVDRFFWGAAVPGTFRSGGWRAGGDSISVFIVFVIYLISLFFVDLFVGRLRALGGIASF